jgi:uncharacterized membrane protein
MIMNEFSQVLIAGETWISHFFNIKGRNDYSGAEFFENPGVLRLTEVLSHKEYQVTHLPNHRAVYDFPFSVEELSKYVCVILSDIGADTLQLHPDTVNLRNPQRVPDRLKVLKEFVKRGGGLLMVGGWMSFSGIEGKARYHMTPLAEVLPVTMLGYDDRVERCDGFSPTVVVSDHPILNGIDPHWPYFLGYQRLFSKPEAQILMKVDEDPFLIVWDYGEGRVAAFASDCGPHWGSREFMDWTGYELFWTQIVRWLAGENQS